MSSLGKTWCILQAASPKCKEWHHRTAKGKSKGKEGEGQHNYIWLERHFTQDIIRGVATAFNGTLSAFRGTTEMVLHMS